MTFDLEKTIQYWYEGAKYDLGVADAMFKSKKYPYALFMGHLALEKLLKAFFVKSTRAHAPFSHSLSYLAEKSKIKIPEKILIKLREFMEFHFEARYPDVNKAFYSKEPRPQGGALKPKFSKPKTEIPKQVRDDKKNKNRTLMSC